MPLHKNDVICKHPDIRAQPRRWLFWPLQISVPFCALLLTSGLVDHCAQDTRFCPVPASPQTACNEGPACMPAPQDGPDAHAIAQGASHWRAPDTPIPVQASLRNGALNPTLVPLPFSLSTQSQRSFVLPHGQTLHDMATQTAQIDLDHIVLIAVIEQNAGRHALVRLPDGHILRLRQGDPLEGGTVAAIGDTALYLLGPDLSPRAYILGG
ncbi:hypothetical protein LY56_00240 [Roseinatronobacter thiooxidans]|uniref:Uncharacterized protein n=2 Tax=Roseinatronobacter thiooxidans TaxID=121821 RepID=A0A2W7SBW5_9RHOB|nr:hypothetical protein LY56_00240 [Roseinatronobacter thiooxidans]